jgi:hypothetical protein
MLNKFWEEASADDTKQDAILNTIDKIDVTYKDLKRLRKRFVVSPIELWLNDSIVDFYFAMLQSQFKNVCCSFNHSFMDKAYYNNDSTYQYKPISRWTHKKNRSINVFSKQTILIPKNNSNNHWILIYTSNDEKKIFILDSLQLCTKNEKNIIQETIASWLQDESKLEFENSFGKKEDWTLLFNDTIKIKPQNNNFDCGVFVCMAGYFLVNGIPLNTLLQEDIGTYRDFVLLSILEYKNLFMLANLSSSSLSDNNSRSYKKIEKILPPKQTIEKNNNNVISNIPFIKINEKCNIQNEKRLFKLIDTLNREFEVEHKKTLLATSKRICGYKLMETLNYSVYKDLFIDLAYIFSLDLDEIEKFKETNFGIEKNRKVIINKMIESHNKYCC